MPLARTTTVLLSKLNTGKQESEVMKPLGNNLTLICGPIIENRTAWGSYMFGNFGDETMIMWCVKTQIP